MRWCADLGPWRAPADTLLPKAEEVGSPSRLRRRIRRAAERSAAAAKAGTESVVIKKGSAENVVAFDMISAAEEAAARQVAAVKAVAAASEKAVAEKAKTGQAVAEKAAVEKSVTDQASSVKVAAVKPVEGVLCESIVAKAAEDTAIASRSCCRGGGQQAMLSCWNCDQLAADSDYVASTSCAAPLVQAQSQVLDIAETAEVEEVDAALSCRNCEGKFTASHQCSDSLAPPVTSSKGAAILLGKGSPTPALLPLCHYCCHKGSGLHKVHYYVQCLCSDQVCTCQCYCDEKQLEHKKVFFPSGFSGISCVEPKDRQKAMSIAEARANKPDYRGFPMAHRPCDDENCVLDHLKLKPTSD